jgi:hypothetical protein
MPAVSKSQQRLMAQAYGVKKGDINPKELNPEYRKQIEDLAKSMTLKQLKDYAETEHKNLPNEVIKENSPIATLSSVNGMGPLSLPVGDKPGSGDIPHPIPSKKKKFKKYKEFVKESLLFESRIKGVDQDSIDKTLKDNGIEFDTIDKKDKFVWVIKNGKKKVALYEPSPKVLNIIDPKKEVINSEPTELDLKIHELLSDWVISSLDDYSKRDKIAKELLKINIPEEYKQIDSRYLYRVVNMDKDPSSNFKLSKEGIARSWAYHQFGIEKMKNWYLDIYGDEGIFVMVKKPVTNVIICIPNFYNKFPKLLYGKKHSGLVFSEYEVICKNEEPLISVNSREYQIL